ncbi:MAG TPA: heme o synthase [Thermodesulfobacteriota bacterium]|nr:heme o synthase [Thermodesulfobacteriota bacterium]
MLKKIKIREKIEIATEEEREEKFLAGKILVSTLLLLKPGIILSIAFTGFAGMVLAYRGVPPVDFALLGMVSLILSAGGSAILNNILDRQVDVLMNRLNRRVEALQVVGERAALLMSLLFIAISLFISFSFINAVNGLLIIIAILSYTFLYTLYLKRSSPYGTIPGGLPGALPVLIGYSAVNPALGVDGIILFIIMILWQPPHFWALAQKYRDEYKRAGVPVMPVVFGREYTNILMLIYSLSLLPLSLSLWFFGYCSIVYAVMAVIAGLYFEFVMVQGVLRGSNYGKAFGVSIVYILALMASLIIDVSLNPATKMVLTNLQ